MLFKIKELKQLLSSITKYKVENIQVKSKNLEVVINTMKNRNKVLISTINKPNTSSQSDINQQSINPSKQNNIKKTNKEKEQYVTIVSPMIGTFYRSPAPNETPFIKVNDIVKINQTVCIIEAMKLMNEIESEVNGHIAEILVEDGDIVDCGQALIRIKQDKKK